MKNKGFLLATSVGAAFAPAGGHAADLAPIYKAPPPVAPVATWTGFYIGGHAGAAWQQMSATGNQISQGYVNQSFFAAYGTGTTTLHTTSALAGGQIGYNWQQGNFLFGLEGDGSWLSKGSGSSTGASAYAQTSGRIKWLSTARIRFGLVMGDTMAYATGGVAFGGVSNCQYCNFTGGFAKSDTKTRVGWAVGFGVEHMLTRNWIIGLEGLFVDLGSRSVSVDGSASKATRFSNQAMIGRLKLNYKF